MGERTGITWTDRTFNPWIGCTRESTGCEHCYAETMVTGRMGRPEDWGPKGTRRRTTDAYWRGPHKWDRESATNGRAGEPGGHREERLRVFCASLADVFEPRPELNEWRHELFDLITATPHLDWQLLTKRPEFARDWLRSIDFTAEDWSNVWLGVSIENARYTWRADVLREIPAAVRFISAEPLLGSLFPPDRATHGVDRERNTDAGLEPGSLLAAGRSVDASRASLNLAGIDWVIVGGESGGRNARPMKPEWVGEILSACAGGHPPGSRNRTRDGVALPALYFKQWGSHDAAGVYRGAAPGSAGKSLFGIDWCEFPDSAPSGQLVIA